MPTVPAPKHHQPLHNFSLPFLKWGQRLHLNNHCHRRLNRNSPLTDSDSDHRSRFRNRKIDGENGYVLPENGNGSRKLIGVDVTEISTADFSDSDVNNRKRFRNRKVDGKNGYVLPENGNDNRKVVGVDVTEIATADFSDSDLNSRKRFRNRKINGKSGYVSPENGNNRVNVIGVDVAPEDSSDSDVKNRKPFRNRKTGGVLPKNGNGVDVTETVTADDGDVKLWNLRPRRLVIDAVDGNVTPATINCTKSRRLLRDEENEEYGKKKRRLWISLSKDEIEEDVYAFTGSRPVRRPKKRNKTAQKHVDNVFPGLYLVGVSADSYRV